VTALAHLAQICQRWGGELIILPDSAFNDMLTHPDVTSHPSESHAIDHKRRQIFATHEGVCPGTVIHEMGHIFLEEADPSTTFEPDWLGWEIALAHQVRCYRAWSAQNTGYNFTWRGKNQEWGELILQEERRFIANRFAHARRLGILDRKGRPLCTRQGPLTSH
jgi:hypothetical protein